MTDQVLERLWEKVQVQSNGCWNWLGYKTSGGYGQFKPNGKTIYAHRFAYEVNKGKIPEGLTIDHLCSNPSCINPDHLEAVTMQENILRGEGLAGKNARKTHCPKGHELKESNLQPYQYTHYNQRSCRICFNENHNRCSHLRNEGITKL